MVKLMIRNWLVIFSNSWVNIRKSTDLQAPPPPPFPPEIVIVSYIPFLHNFANFLHQFVSLDVFPKGNMKAYDIVQVVDPRFHEEAKHTYEFDIVI